MKTKTLLRSVILLTIIFSYFTSCKTINENLFCYSYEGRPTQALMYSEISAMLNAYESTNRIENLKRMRAVGRLGDTKEAWFEINALKKYLAYVEKLSKEKNIELTGITMKFAAYPNDESKHGRKANHQTLIFVPTTKSNTSSANYMNFDPLNSDIGKAKSFEMLLAEYNRDPNNTNGGSGGQFLRAADLPSAAANRTQISPPE